MPHRLLVVLAGLLLLVLGLPALAAAAPADVTLRVEGATATLLPRTAVRTDTRTVNKDGTAGHDCTGTSVAGALEIGLNGDWSGTWFAGLGYSVDRIRTETPSFNPDFFELRINNRTQQVGICDSELQTGDDILFFVSSCSGFGPPPDFACLNPVLPLGLTAPSTVGPGVPFNVTVVEFAPDGTPKPVAGATVEGGDAAVQTGAGGVAVVTTSAAGPVALRATMPGHARSALQSVCATTGSDGLCGTAVPNLLVPGCTTNGADGLCGTLDRDPSRAHIEGITEQQRFARGKGPRELHVKVTPDPSGIFAVKLRLTRNDRGRCTYYSGKSERFRTPRGAKCGVANGFWFGVGDREDTSYLLPRALPRGHYVLDVNVIDKAFNRDEPRRRGANRIVFDVG